jgi:hypothetical protein
MVFDASRYLTLNNYGYSPESIAIVKEYLRTRVLPESLDNSAKKKRFLAKWEKDFKIENNKLVYIPLNLIVVPDDQRNIVLLNIYKDLRRGVGQGISMFYNRVRDKYLNIRRKVWIRPLKTQTAVNVRNALINIVQETKTYPKIIQADNGSEFKKETSEWMKEHDIVYIKTLSYSPESNGLVEGKNKIVRKVLREIMIRRNSRNWTNYLQICADLMNTQRNGTTKENPDDIWREGHELAGEKNEDESQ